MPMRHSAAGNTVPPDPRRDVSAPVRTRREAIAFLVVYAGVVVTVGLIFDWDRAYYAAAGTVCLWCVGALVFHLTREIRRSRSGGHQQPQGPAIDWLAIRHAEVRVQGSPGRYVAHFEGTLTPPTGNMNEQEQKVARALTLLGFPPATVSTLDNDAPAPPSSTEDGTPYAIEIPGG